MRRIEWYVESYVATGMLIAAYSVKTRGVWIVMTTANLFIFATFARKEYSGKYISAKLRYYHMSRSTIKPTIRDFNGHLPYPFQNPISNFYLSLEAGKSSTDSVILRKLTNVEIIFRAWTKSLKRTKLYFDD